MKKIISIILIILMLMGTVFMPNKAVASFTIDKIDLYSKGTYKDYLYWNGMGLVFDYVVYEKDGQEYPAYCLNRELTGVNTENQYCVNVEELLTNIKVWRAIINGYPYKSLNYLGCKTKEEAYMATKQAVYCMLYDRDPNTYIGRGETGIRTTNALKQIVFNARLSTEVKVSAELEIQELTSKWLQDEIDKKYISKKYTINANSTIDTYSVKLEGMNVEGAKIVDENNCEKTDFKYGENFKIIIPITNMQKDGSFNIKVKGKVATKPILYGYSTDPNLQDYALTGEIYEDGSGIKTVNYTKNETKIIILKQDEDGNLLEGVKFRILNDNQEVLYTDITTNKEGKIIINNLEPGTYFLEETSTINGYAIYEEHIQAEVGYNEELTIKVTNSKETIEVEKPEVLENEEEIVVKLPKTGM